jgi:hypothetical protein
VPLETATHGGRLVAHQEGLINQVHMAIWDEQQGHAPGTGPMSAPVVSWLTADLAAAEQSLLARGAVRRHRPIDLGEGKRVVTFDDPDGRPFRLIEMPGEAG